MVQFVILIITLVYDFVYVQTVLGVRSTERFRIPALSLPSSFVSSQSQSLICKVSTHLRAVVKLMYVKHLVQWPACVGAHYQKRYWREWLYKYWTLLGCLPFPWLLIHLLGLRDAWEGVVLLWIAARSLIASSDGTVAHCLYHETGLPRLKVKKAGQPLSQQCLQDECTGIQAYEGGGLWPCQLSWGWGAFFLSLALPVVLPS